MMGAKHYSPEVRERAVWLDEATRPPESATMLRRRSTLWRRDPHRRAFGNPGTVQTLEGWPSVAMVLDLFSRRVVVWWKNARMTSELAADALVMATPAAGANEGRVAT